MTLLVALLVGHFLRQHFALARNSGQLVSIAALLARLSRVKPWLDSLLRDRLAHRLGHLHRRLVDGGGSRQGLRLLRKVRDGLQSAERESIHGGVVVLLSSGKLLRGFARRLGSLRLKHLDLTTFLRARVHTERRAVVVLEGLAGLAPLLTRISRVLTDLFI